MGVYVPSVEEHLREIGNALALIAASVENQVHSLSNTTLRNAIHAAALQGLEHVESLQSLDSDVLNADAPERAKGGA